MAFPFSMARPPKRKQPAASSSPASAPAPATPPPALKPAEILGHLEKYSLHLVIALLLIGTVRIVSTYNVFSYTFDEPAHLACGMEWLDKGVYTWEPQHPPLARVAASLGPYLSGLHSQNTKRDDEFAMTREGLAILFNNQRPDEILMLARVGILPFYWIGCLSVFWWARRYSSAAIAVIALFLYSFLPPILAHAGLATTDMACTALLSAAFLAAVVWAEEPGLRTGAMLGMTGGLALVSKFSVLPYFAVAAAFALAWHWFRERPKIHLQSEVRRRAPSLALAGGIGFLIVWAVYRFSFGKVFFADISLPAPEFFAGIRDVLKHNAEGHPGFLLGQMTRTGFWYFYLVDLAVKTPLAFLALFAAGAMAARSRSSKGKTTAPRGVWLPLAFSAGVLSVAMFSHINIGIRHVMPIYAGMCITAATGLAWLLESNAARQWVPWAGVLLVAWFGLSSLASHPDYLPYFNALAGSHPENVVVDSDLDWGQDMKRLGARLREVNAPEVHFLPLQVGSMEAQYGLPPVVRRIDAMNPAPGWNAVSLTLLKQRRMGLRDRYPNYSPWPERFDSYEMIGKSTRLYFFERR
jgi:hypothetical protein